MIRPSRFGVLLVGLGVAIGLLSIRFGGATQRACPGIESVVYRTVGVHPAGVAITDVEFTTATVEWYDGCNWRDQSLVPLVLGGIVSVAGIVVTGANESDS
jgi:hypothetical protein